MVNSRVERLYHGDCLFVLRHDIQPDSVALIYLDPPFFTGKVQKGTWQPGALEISFDDSRRFWAEHQEEMRNAAPVWMRHLALERPDFASYLWYMMVRLQACRYVLKPTGSIYLHCDWRASHYLKMVMDEIFGHNRFLSEIIWALGAGGRTSSYFANKHNTIFLYQKGDSHTFNTDSTSMHKPYSSSTLAMHFTRKDKDGRRYRVQKKGGREYITYEDRGQLVDTVWTDIGAQRATSPIMPESTGFPTQKPEALLVRIITASSSPGDVVLDPFCGSGTTIAVAKKLDRQWIGIESSDEAIKIVEWRLACVRIS